MLTLPSKFAAELAKAENTPSFLVQLEDETLYNEQTLQADWAANSQNNQVDWLAQPGSVMIENTPKPENLTGDHWETISKGMNQGTSIFWQSFKQTTGGARTLQNIKVFCRKKKGGAATTVYCTLFQANKTTQIGTTLSLAVASNAGEDRVYDFSSQGITIADNTQYWIKIWADYSTGSGVYIYCNSTSSYSNGQLDMDIYYPGEEPYTVAKIDVGELLFAVSLSGGGYYKSSGYIRTQTMDLGQTPASNGEWILEDIQPTGTSIAYEAWASATGAFAGEETSLGTIQDGDAITNLKRYYRVKATLTANGDQSVSPTLQSIKADFTTFRPYSDNPSLGYETAILSVSSLSSSIDTFKASTVGQITFTLNLSASVSAYLATKKPKNKLVKVLAGFVTDGFAEADYIDYSRGQIDDWNITAKDEVTITVKDFSKEWDVDVPKATDAGLPEVSWAAVHPVDAMLDILKNHINARDSKILGSSFGTVKAALPDWIVSRTLKEDTVSAKDLMEELRLLTSTYFLPQADGTIKIKRWNADESPVDTLTDADFSTKKWDSDAKQIINRYVHFYGWDGEGDDAADFSTVSIGIDTTSQTGWRETTSKELKDKWTPTTQTAQVADFLDKVMKRYANPPSILQGEVDLRKMALELGDIVTVTTKRAPSSDMGGINNIKFQIINRNIDYSKHKLSLTLLECASSVNTQVEPPAAQPTPYDMPEHVSGLTIVEQEYVNKDGSYSPLVVVTYDLPPNSTYWSHAIIQTSIDGGLTYKDYGLDYLKGAGFIIDASQVGGFVGGTFEVRVISVNTQDVQAPSATAPTASLAKIGEGTVLTAPPSAPRGLTIEGNPDPNDTTWDGLRFALTWWKASQTGGAGNEGNLGAGGFVDPYWNGDEYELWVGGACIDSGITKEARYDYVYGDGYLDFLDDKIAAAHGTVTFKVRRVSLNLASEWTTISITQVAPATPTGLSSDFTGSALVLKWNKATETDFDYYELALNSRTIKLTDPQYTYSFDENVKDNTTADPSIAYSLKTYDIYGNASSALTGTFTNPVPATPAGLNTVAWIKGVEFAWAKNAETDIRGYSVRTKIVTGAWSSWVEQTENNYIRMLTDSEVATYGAGAAIYIEVKAVDIFAQESTVAAASAVSLFVDVAVVADGSITAPKIAGGAVGTTQLADAAITTAKIANTAVDNTKLAALAVDTAKLADSAVTTTKIANAAVGSAAIANLAVGTAHIADAAITNAKIEKWILGKSGTSFPVSPVDGESFYRTDLNISYRYATSTASWIAVDYVADAGRIVDGVITSVKIADAAISSAKIADLAVSNAKIAEGTIQTAKIADAQITGAKIASATIQTANIADAQITGAKIASATIQTANIADAQITGAKIASATIQTANIADAQITGAKIASATIQTANIADAQITGAKIASATITDANISSLNADKITAGNIRGIGIYGSTHATKGSYLTASCSGGATSLNVKDTTDFPSSGSGWVIDSANDQNVFSWTGKTATTLTGCSGVLAHAVSAGNVPVVVPSVKTITISDVVNELRLFGDRGDGVIDFLGSIGDKALDSSFNVLCAMGNSNYEDFAGWFESKNPWGTFQATNRGVQGCAIIGQAGGSGFNTLNGFAGVLGRADWGTSGNRYGVIGYGATYDFYAAGSGTNYGPFTGSHPCILSSGLKTNDIPLGAIISVQGPTYKQINSASNIVPVVALSSRPFDNTCYGVRNSSPPGGLPDWICDQIDIERQIIVNALGEGQILVCNEEGNICNGDYICSSSLPGYGMRQTENTLKNYTVAKSLENVNFSDGLGPRLIACTYHCG